MKTVDGKLIAYTSLLSESVPVGTRVIGTRQACSVLYCCYYAVIPRILCTAGHLTVQLTNYSHLLIMRYHSTYCYQICHCNRTWPSNELYLYLYPLNPELFACVIWMPLFDLQLLNLVEWCLIVSHSVQSAGSGEDTLTSHCLVDVTALSSLHMYSRW